MKFSLLNASILIIYMILPNFLSLYRYPIKPNIFEIYIHTYVYKQVIYKLVVFK